MVGFLASPVEGITSDVSTLWDERPLGPAIVLLTFALPLISGLALARWRTAGTLIAFVLGAGIIAVWLAYYALDAIPTVTGAAIMPAVLGVMCGWLLVLRELSSRCLRLMPSRAMRRFVDGQ
jgi:hypothetical protein